MGRTRSDQSSAGFGRGQATTLAIAGILGAAWIGGTVAGKQRFDPVTGVSPLVATNIEAATAPARKSGVTWDLPNLEHDRVDYWVERFSTDKRDDFAIFLERSGRYAPMILEKLDERGMPRDLLYLAMIELIRLCTWPFCFFEMYLLTWCHYRLMKTLIKI